jgi:hypothetical protein
MCEKSSGSSLTDSRRWAACVLEIRHCADGNQLPAFSKTTIGLRQMFPEFSGMKRSKSGMITLFSLTNATFPANGSAGAQKWFRVMSPTEGVRVRREAQPIRRGIPISRITIRGAEWPGFHSHPSAWRVLLSGICLNIIDWIGWSE